MYFPDENFGKYVIVIVQRCTEGKPPAKEVCLSMIRWNN
jgi:uncharacterized protein (UPF0248 family)